jgi:hypothetical protein
MVLLLSNTRQGESLPMNTFIKTRREESSMFIKLRLLFVRQRSMFDNETICLVIRNHFIVNRVDRLLQF